MDHLAWLNDLGLLLLLLQFVDDEVHLVIGVDGEHLEETLEVPEFGEVAAAHVLVVLHEHDELVVVAPHLLTAHVVVPHVRICCALIAAHAVEVVLLLPVSLIYLRLNLLVDLALVYERLLGTALEI